MKMRTLDLMIAGFVIAALAPSTAGAATTSHLVAKGSSADVQVANISADGCIQIGVNLTAATFVSRPDGSSGSELVAGLFLDDFCNFTHESGFTFIPLTNEVQIGNSAATLNVTFTIETFDDLGNGPFTHTISANVQLAGTNDTTSGLSLSRFRGGGAHVVSNGRSVSNFATVGGQVSVDSQPLLPDGFASGSIERSMNVIISVTK
jgi:hypothetical protein